MAAIILIIIVLILYILMYQKFYKKNKSVYSKQYFREIPGDYTPDIVSYLLYQKVTNKALKASIINLIRKKAIYYEKLYGNNYLLRMITDSNAELLRHEKALMNFIFLNSKSIQTDDIKKNLKANELLAVTAWNNYNAELEGEIGQYDFYENEILIDDSSSATFAIFYFFAVGFITFGIYRISPCWYYVGIAGVALFPIFTWYIKLFGEAYLLLKEKIAYYIISLLILLFSIYRFIYILAFQRSIWSSSILYLVIILAVILFNALLRNYKQRTQKGMEEYDKWRGLERYLKNFDSFKEKDIIDINLWEQYIVYATFFGCSKKIVKAMKTEKIETFDMSDFNKFDRVINHFMNNSYKFINTASVDAAALNVASGAISSISSNSNNSSSGSGKGGGFSSGGGTFGGGGGGSRF